MAVVTQHHWYIERVGGREVLRVTARTPAGQRGAVEEGGAAMSPLLPDLAKER